MIYCNVWYAFVFPTVFWNSVFYWFWPSWFLAKCTTDLRGVKGTCGLHASHSFPKYSPVASLVGELMCRSFYKKKKKGLHASCGTLPCDLNDSSCSCFYRFPAVPWWGLWMLGSFSYRCLTAPHLKKNPVWLKPFPFVFPVLLGEYIDNKGMHCAQLVLCE